MTATASVVRIASVSSMTWYLRSASITGRVRSEPCGAGRVRELRAFALGVGDPAALNELPQAHDLAVNERRIAHLRVPSAHPQQSLLAEDPVRSEPAHRPREKRLVPTAGLDAFTITGHPAVV